MPKGAKRLLALFCATLSLLPSVSADAGTTHTVVVLYSDDRFLPANIEGDRGLRSAIANPGDGGVELFDEHLDHPHFGGSPEYERTISTYLHDKYLPLAPEIVALPASGMPIAKRPSRRGVPFFCSLPCRSAC